MNRAPIFDAFRDFMGGSLTQVEVDAMDEFLDRFGPRDAALRVGPKGIELIKSFEGCKLRAYPDPGTGGEPFTVGWGTTRIDGKPVPPGLAITQERADELLERDLGRYAAQVRAAIGDAPTSQEQFDALVSFHYNTGAIGKATLTKKHKAGDYAGAAREFDRWNRAGGRVLKGLVRRRAAERKLYESGS